MKPLPSLLALLLCGCQTVLYGPDGKPLARIQSDATNLAYARTADGAVSFTADRLSNSTATNAAGRIVNTVAVMGTAAITAVQSVSAINAVRKPIP